ncbi:MAG: hypothetical protein NC185_08370, partial [Ruminococcus sp.]|nr:hypothetical protein [Ruminococcus sp.]
QKKKKHKKHYPPLSKMDKNIYRSFTALSFLLCFSFIIIRYKWTTNYFHNRENVLAYNPSASLMAMIPFAFTILICTLIIGDILLDGKYPIFGNPKVDYNDPKYLFTLPRFDKRYDSALYKKKMKLTKAAKRTIVSFVIVFLVTYSISLLAIFGRTELQTNAIETYNCFNIMKNQYSYSDVVSLDIESHPQGRFSRYNPTSISIYLTFSDGKNMCFDDSTFNGNVYAMNTVVEKLSDTEKQIDDSHLDEFINHYEFTDDEIRIINQLFDK